MTQDEIIRFAIQCRLVTTGNRDGLYMDALTEFAHLVAAKEREALAQPEQAHGAWAMPRGWWIVESTPDELNMWPTNEDILIDNRALLAQRTWVGLTDDEIAQGWKESWVTEQAWQSAVWWAEGKLRDKNT